MQVVYSVIILVLSILFAKNASSQNFSESLDSLFEKKLPQLGLHQVKMTWKSGKTVFTDIQTFNPEGKRIEHLYHDGTASAREKMEFDEKGKLKTTTYYSSKDTSSIDAKYIYTYSDSLNHTLQIFNGERELSQTQTYQTKQVKDTIWVTKTRKATESSHISKSLTRSTQKGDSLQLSETIKFDELGKMVDITTHFELKRKDSAGNTIIESGRYDARIDESLMIYGDPMRNPEPYIQNQLKGMYPYVSIEDYTPSKTYNSSGQIILIQEAYGKTVFHYNELTQLVKFEHFTNPAMTGEKEEKTSETIFYYDSQGLPIRVSEISLTSGKTIDYQLEFN